MDVKYREKGEKGKTCGDCSFFQPEGDKIGKCFGHEVLAGGTCSLFKAKAKKE